MKKSYSELSIKEYLELRDVLTSVESEDDLSYQVAMLAYLNGKTEDDVLNLNLADYHKLVSETQFLMEMPKPTNKPPFKIKIGNYELEMTKDVARMSVAQYVDFNHFITDENRDKFTANIVACLYVPKGKKYNDGYDVEEVTKLIEENLSIQTAVDVGFFFLKRFLRSIDDTLLFSQWRMKKLMRKTKDETMKMKLKEAMNQIQMYRDSLQDGNGLS